VGVPKGKSAKSAHNAKKIPNLSYHLDGVSCVWGC